MLALTSLVYTSLEHIRLLKNGESLLTTIEVDLLSLRRNEKDFLSRKQLKYTEDFLRNSRRLKVNVSTLKQLLADESFATNNIDIFSNQFQQFKLKFAQLVSLQRQIGLTPTDGLYGQLRQMVHRAEQQLATLQQPSLVVAMLMLRRHEKDFMLRKDKKYITKFSQQYAETLSIIKRGSLSKGAVPKYCCHP